MKCKEQNQCKRKEKKERLHSTSAIMRRGSKAQLQKQQKYQARSSKKEREKSTDAKCSHSTAEASSSSEGKKYRADTPEERSAEPAREGEVRSIIGAQGNTCNTPTRLNISTK